MLSKLQQFWDKHKAFFKYSETVLWARIQAVFGLLVVVISNTDWSPLFSTMSLDTGFSRNQAIWTGIGIFANGLWTEYLRRRNANL